jgi:hypothetical protein
VALPNGRGDASQNYRAGGSTVSGWSLAHAQALHIVVPSELSNAAIDALYLSCKASLAEAGISI